ncbi:beta-ketoacyl synthase N-terminal-like domain-containing protein [Entomohabitans teleogrylli]|uniref:beta-ketoacyl synthase N-terminal-like domain-containing protein n=1 Tax=Entomohabitans teleogrylli TaxID=1384589 RepID=UPI00073D44A0|nr:beta-ketoacyl synthase N-terminal-like domain-containing protein [Entomohabitans teleogrylli]
MNHTVTASGWAVASGYAPDFPALIAGLESGKLACGSPWFSDDAWQTMRLKVNPHVVADARPRPAPFDRLRKVIDRALAMASLPATALAGQRVRVYVTGSGVRPDIGDFLGYQDRNDSEDLLFFPQIKRLHADSYGQDLLADALLRRYRLSWPPVALYSASNSSLSALHLARTTLAAGQADLALVLGWNEMLLQDILFLGGQDMLGDGQSQPFSAADSSVLPASGAVALVLESARHARQRGLTPRLVLHPSVCCQSGGGSAFTADFRSIAQTLEQALRAASLAPDDISAVLPHGNGIIASDKAEAMAIKKIWGRQGIPVVSYKGQIGYISTCSGVQDLMIAADALLQRRLLALTSRSQPDASLDIRLHADAAPLPLDRPHLLKYGAGLDGSVIALAISACREVDDD